MMTKKEFINKLIGTKWVNRGYDFSGCDCFGLVYLYMLHVKKTAIELTPDYLKNECFSVAFQSQLDAGRWNRVDRPKGDDIVFMCFAGDIPMHCGVMIGRSKILHSFGSCNSSGQVSVWDMDYMISVLQRFYKLNEKPRLEFYKWES